MKKLFDILTAVAFAEEGDFETAKSLIKVKERRVLLALDNVNISNKVLKYTINICKRLNTSLDIITSVSDQTKLSAFFRELQTQDIKFSTTFVHDCIKQAIVEYTESHNDTLFVVLPTSSDIDSGCKSYKGKFSDLWKKLRCPLVVLTAEA